MDDEFESVMDSNAGALMLLASLQVSQAISVHHVARSVHFLKRLSLAHDNRMVATVDSMLNTGLPAQ